MNDSRFMVDHVRLATDKPFEAQLGNSTVTLRKVATASEDIEEAKEKITAMAGPSGFMLFGTSDHGAPPRLAGQKRKAIQYVVGNPVFALQMTQHDIRVSPYAPLRVLIYENDEGKTAWNTTSRPRCSASLAMTASTPPPPCSTGSWMHVVRAAFE